MTTKELIVCAVFVSGAAVMYGTEKTCEELAAWLPDADVREIYSFNDLKL